MYTHPRYLPWARLGARFLRSALAGTFLSGTLLLLVGAATASPRPAAPPATRYRATLINAPTGRVAFPLAISSNNAIAGQIETGQEDADGFTIYHAFVWRNGVLTELPTLGGPSARALGVNSNGDVVGESQREESGAYHAFLWRNNQMIDLGQVLGAEEASAALGINDVGQVVGTLGHSYFGDAFVWSQANGVTNLGPGSARGINASGTVVGAIRTDEGQNLPAVWEEGVLQVLPDLGGKLNNYASAVNDSGVIVGTSEDLQGNMKPARWQRTGGEYAITDLGVLPSESQFPNTYGAATGINNNGQIVGQSDYRAFIWQNNVMAPLADLVPLSERYFVTFAAGINHLGNLAVDGIQFVNNVGSVPRAGLLTPGQAPTTGAELSGLWDTAQQGRRLPKVRQTGRGRGAKYQISGTFVVKNTGGTAAKKPKVGFYLSNDGDPNNPVPDLGLLKAYPVLNAGKSRGVAISVSIPLSKGIDPRGKYVIAVVDPLNAIDEQDEENNVVVYGPLQ